MVNSLWLKERHVDLQHFNQSINQSVNVQSGLSSDATARTTVGVTVKKCHGIMSTGVSVVSVI